MTTTRSVGAAASWGWLRRAVNLGRDNPKAVFGGALLLLLAMLALALASVLLSAGAGFAARGNGVVAGLVSSLAMLAMTALMAILIAGYLRLLDAVERGHAVGAGAVFAVLGERRMAVNAVVFMLVLMLAQNLLLALLIAGLAPEFGNWYLQVLQAGPAAAPAAAPPAGFGLAMVAIWVVTLFAYGVQSLGFGQIALGGRDWPRALADGVQGTLRNLPALLLLFLLAIAAALVLALVMALVVALAVLLSKLVGGWLVALVALPVYLAFVVALVVVMFGVMYYMWRDICGAEAPAAPVQDARIAL